MRPYQVWSPPASKSGGVRALKALVGELRLLGHRADLTTRATVDPDAIVVYPEIEIPRADRSVRWLLNRGGRVGTTFAWSHLIDATVPRLAVNIVDLGTFRPGTATRSGVAWYRGKGAGTHNAAEITRDLPANRHALANLLRSVDHLVSFDPFSCLNLEATLCGTPVLMAGAGWTREQIEGQEFGTLGYAWRPDDLPAARVAAKGAYDHYLSLLPGLRSTVEAFARDTQAAFA